MMMSFLGSIGFAMNGSGLSNVLETAYGPNAISHMMSGKAVSRAIRGHFLVDSALMIKLMQKVTPSTINVTNDDAEYAEQILDDEQPLTEPEGQSLPESDLLTLSHEDMDNLEDLYKDLYQDHLSADDASEQRELSSMQRLFNEYTDTLVSKSRTAKLWL